MPRIKGVEIPDNRQVTYALTYIKGVGLSTSEKIVKELGLDGVKKAKELTEGEINKIGGLLDSNYVIEGELNRRVRDNIKRLQTIGTYRGDRHKKNLPVRGQRTQKNARTRKGPKKSVSGVSVRKAVSKT